MVFFFAYFFIVVYNPSIVLEQVAHVVTDHRRSSHVWYESNQFVIYEKADYGFDDNLLKLQICFVFFSFLTHDHFRLWRLTRAAAQLNLLPWAQLLKLHLDDWISSQPLAPRYCQSLRELSLLVRPRNPKVADILSSRVLAQKHFFLKYDEKLTVHSICQFELV